MLRASEYNFWIGGLRVKLLNGRANSGHAKKIITMITLSQQTIHVAGYGRVAVSIRDCGICEQEQVLMHLRRQVSKEMEAYLATTHQRRLDWDKSDNAWYLRRSAAAGPSNGLE